MPTPPAPLEPRRLLARVQKIMGGRRSANARLGQVVREVAEAMGSDVCSCYLRRAGNLLERADYWFHRHAQLLKDMNCEQEPSHYWRQNFRVTFMRDLTGVAARDIIGTETMMWGNDFPHHVSTWPHSQAVIAEHFADASDDVRHAIVSGNVRQLYDIQV